MNMADIAVYLLLFLNLTVRWCIVYDDGHVCTEF